MSLSNNLSKILIIDFGSQFTQLIARRVRELGVFSEIVSHKKIKITQIIKENIAGVILSGGPLNVYENDKFKFEKKILKLGVPILGICFGHQVLSKLLGGKVKKSKHREFGLATIKKVSNSILTKNFFNKDKTSNVWMSHADQVSKMPKNFNVIASSKNSKLTIIENIKDNFYGVQFHPEVTHTNKGKILLRNFVFLICKTKKNWSSKDQKLKLINEIKQQIGNNKVICGLSGGVDSSVVAQLLSKAIGKNLTCIFVNNGLLRKNEETQVVNTFKKRLKINLIYVNAEKEFIRKLTNVSDPEKKRKIIGNLFIKIFERYAKKIKNVHYLAQGTLYPDLIESKSVTGSQTSKIKSHHNVGGLPKRMKLKLVEPLKFLFKDEVRKLGLELNLSNDLISRHPFPGPGLAIRMPGIITNEKIKILKEADFYFTKALRDHGLYDKIWQAYAALLPVKTVGVMGDNRTYEHICLLRAITSEDGMTADFFDFPKGFMQSISNQIINNIRGINRVVYDVTSKPPSTIELE
ncbi:glutamine-hydrolyzing GMP synthase [Candidatus Pelagibacter giovannonii]|uniref:GMP synthase [glutamine-hydrolyzing] n=1 Tax=Candidatus Pelagibacter giovannonii TaxID=2563896 RepID=A0A6H1Q1C6_9PROT|nr:glutamine-hydrolyzing GMP synthase [Candidatus Pelagibacter giovannonii]QIZ20717.1 glutamine-hydrolyzing GMP synthase [Candidatus Pelagibacter giovannonii]